MANFHSLGIREGHSGVSRQSCFRSPLTWLSCIEEHGHRPATLRVAASAIAFVHKTVGMDDPCASLEVKRTLRSATRKAGRSQKQAEALTVDALDAIRSTACKPRRGRGGRFEGQKTARCRGNLDIALISCR